MNDKLEMLENIGTIAIALGLAPAMIWMSAVGLPGVV